MTDNHDQLIDSLIKKAINQNKTQNEEKAAIDALLETTDLSRQELEDILAQTKLELENQDKSDLSSQDSGPSASLLLIPYSLFLLFCLAIAANYYNFEII